MINEGIFYCTIDDEQTDAYLLKYNPDSSVLFDITCLIIDSTIYTIELIVNLLENLYMINPIEKKEISYTENKNVEWLLQTFKDFYSTISWGIYDSTENDPMNSELSNKLNRSTGNAQ